MKLLTELDSLDNVKDGETRKLITKATSSGLGNVVSSVSVSGDTVTYTKGVTALTAHQNTFSNVKVGSTTVAADSAGDTLELVAGSNVTLTPDATNDKVTIAATDTTYESKAAASGGTAVSLVTTGEKYTWNNKGNGTITGVSVNGTSVATSGVANITSVPASVLSGTIPSAVTATTQNQSDNSTKLATTAYVRSAISALPAAITHLKDGSALGSVRSDRSQTEGEDYNIGQDSFTLGYHTKASGSASFAIGTSTNASGSWAFASGHSSVASGNYSHAEGDGTYAIGVASHAEGNNTYASEDYAHAEGQDSIAWGYASHAEGGSVASNNYAHSEYNGYASGQGAHAEGNSTIASGTASHAEGNGEHWNIRISGSNKTYTVSNTSMLKVGTYIKYDNTLAKITAINNNTITTDTILSGTAITDASATFSNGGIAEGDYAHSEGYNTAALGNNSHAGGNYTIAGYENQTVIGKYNDNKSTTLFEVGKGTAQVRSNAFEVHSDGRATVGAGPSNNLDVATKKYVDDSIVNLPEPMIFKGSLGTGGTITSLPAASSSNEGWTYKVITAGTYASQSAKIGDTFISDGSAWVLIPSGDEPSGTVTSITIKGSSPITVDSESAITTSGTRTISHANSGVTAGTYRSVTVNATGHVTAGTNPTTLSGYGITDAKISNGTITLGRNTITPSTIQNIKDGSATGSVRTSNSAIESTTYTIGPYAFSEGNSTRASGNASHAEGWGSEASGNQSHAEGKATVAAGDYSHSEGYYTTANEDYSHSEGYYTTASGNYGAHSEGYHSAAKGNYSHSEGKYTVASKEGSHAEGYWARAVGKNSHAEGGWDSSIPYNIIGTVVSIDTENKTYEVSGLTRYINSDNNYVGAMYYHTSSGSNESYYISSETYDITTNNFTFGVSSRDPSMEVGGSFYIKISSVALGDFSHSEGINTFAPGKCSHAEGWNTIARYNGSHAEGSNTYAGPFAHAEGYYTEANGDYSHAGGYFTKANKSYQTAIGKYNQNVNHALLEIGNGTADDARSNAFVVYSDGRAELGADPTTAMGVATKQYVENYVNNQDSGWINITASTGTWTKLRYRKIGNMVYVEGDGTFTYGGSTISFATIPTGYRPSISKYAIAAAGGKTVSRFGVTSGGNLFCDWTINVSDGSNATTANLWHNFTLQYFIDE